MKQKVGNLYVVIGLSRLGSEIASSLAKTGKYVAVIDKDIDAFRKLGENFAGQRIIGDASKTKTLKEANIIMAKEIDIVTDDDDTNIYLYFMITALYKNPKIIIRINDLDKMELLPKTGGPKVITPFVNSYRQYINFSEKEEKK